MPDFEVFLLNSIMHNELNKQQSDAVLYTDGPSLIIAGAGSGKTRVLTYKIAHLINSGIPPYRILALTFTNKAANEMKDRIDKLSGDGMSKQLWMGTFHSICFKILRAEAGLLAFDKNFTIYDTLDSKRLVKAIVDEKQLDAELYKPNSILARISNAKNNLQTPEAYQRNKDLTEGDKKSKTGSFINIYSEYCNRLRKSNAMDFDDLLLYTNILFKKYKHIAEKYQNRFDFVLVDEYQDTNFSQYNIIRTLSNTHRKICVVGDDAQSIYGFRGARIENILNFRNHYPDYKLFKLEENYRSTKNIINAAGSLIKNNKNQIPKNLFSNNSTGSKVKIKELFNGDLEGQHIIDTIKNLEQYNFRFKDFAVLYRTNVQSRIIEDALRKANIKYKVFGGLSFYQRREIKDSLAYLRLVANNNDAESMRRIINYPSRKIGGTTLAKIFDFASNKDLSPWEIVSNPGNYNLNINAGTAGRLKSFAEMIAEFSKLSDSESAYDIAKKLFKKTGFIEALIKEDADEKKKEGVERYENFQEFMTVINKFSGDAISENPDKIPSLTEFLENIALITDLDQNFDDDDFVSLMTIHSAKGLEFPNVFIIGAEEKIIPSYLSIESPHEVEEERRLFYVATTRAMKNVFISYCKERYRYGKTERNKPSRFLQDFDEKYIDWEKSTFNEGVDFEDEMDSFSKYPQNSYSKRTGFERQRSQHNKTSSTKQTKMNETFFTKSDKYKPVRDVKRKTNTSPNENFLKGIEVGVIVKHKTFGEGIVTSILPEGEDSKAKIKFLKDNKERTLLLRYAKLEIVS